MPNGCMTFILCLEDSQERMDFVREQFPTVEFRQAITPMEFLDGMDDHPAALILDHDLGLTKWDGYEAVKVLVEECVTDEGSWEMLPVLIWSQNPVGVQDMYRSLERWAFDVSKCPFGPSVVPFVHSLI